MIQHDQPTIFGDRIIAHVSSIEDGPMNFKGNEQDEIVANRREFFNAAGVDVQDATLVQVSYEDTTNFSRYKVVGEEHAGEGILEPVSSLEADALVATFHNQALFLPLADCTGAVIYDPQENYLMLSHLGRHSVEQDGGYKSIQYLAEQYGCDPRELLVWLSPAVGKEDYPLYAFENRGLHEVIVEQMGRAGVALSNIEVSHVNTAANPDYYSHSEFLKGEQPKDDRFAIVAMMLES